MKAAVSTGPASRPETLTIALAGNPNTGKSTLFNALTGRRQRVGNYPGITVERVEGTMRLDGRRARVLDLPGTYSLAAASPDEQIVLDVLAGRQRDLPRPQAVVCVLDATNLRRNLFLASQISELGLPLVLVLNMMDEAAAQGVHVHPQFLERHLGVPVIPAVASRREGTDRVAPALAEVLRNPRRLSPVPWPAPVAAAREDLERAVRADTGQRLSRAEVHRLLFDLDSPLVRRLGWDPGRADRAIGSARGILRGAGLDPISVEAVHRYRHIEGILHGTATRPGEIRRDRAYAIDRILSHRVWGLLAFAGLMLIVFCSIYVVATPLMDGIDGAFAALGNALSRWFAPMPVLRSLLTDGIVAGVGGVLTFLPQILILFFFIALLEDSGYMARAAFLMDKVFSWTGLNGKSFVPMLSSFACAVPSILGTRTIEDPKARLSTILVSPLMSCSARLPIYVLLIGAFLEPRYGAVGAGIALFGMHLLGLVVAIPVAWAINRWILRLRPYPFVLELPPYRRPRIQDVLRRMVRNGREFLLRAGTIILAFSIVIWALTYFPRPAEDLRARTTAAVVRERESAGSSQEPLAPVVERRLAAAHLEQSWLGRFGKRVQPLFAPAGFDWKITVGVLASFPARELIISTFGILYQVGDEEAGGERGQKRLREELAAARWDDGRPVFDPIVALALMVFFALCLQCGSTVAVIAREAGWRWAAFAFTYMTVLAWLAAVAVQQGGRWLAGGG